MSVGYEIELFTIDEFSDPIKCPKDCGKTTLSLGPIIISGTSTGVNAAQNVNVGGVGVFKQQVGAVLEFKGVSGGTAINVTENLVNNEIVVDNARIKVTEVLPSVGPIPVAVSSAALPNTIDSYVFLDSFGNEIDLAVQVTGANTLEICTGGAVLNNVQACLLGT